MLTLALLFVGIVGLGLGYGIAYMRYGNASLIDEMRSKFRELQKLYEEKEQVLQIYQSENTILKQKAQVLLDQNEDFSKMISELTRYYYRIKQVSEKLDELRDIVGIYDEKMENQLHILKENKQEQYDVGGYTLGDSNDSGLGSEDSKYF